MEERMEQQYHHASPQSSPPGAFPEDEINLFDLWRVLVRQWKLIGAITILSFLGAVLYVLLATPVYEAQAVVRQPESKYVAAVNIPGISEITSIDIFASFTGNLKSSTLLQQFFAENPQFSVLYQQFPDQTPQFLRNNLPKIKVGTKNEAGFLFLSLQGHDSKLIADWLNGFILLVDKITLDDFVLGVEKSLANRKKVIETQIQIGQNIAVQRRLDRIALLEEQIGIALTAKIFERNVSSYATVESQRVGETLVTAQESLYMRGVKELTAEKEVLEKRKNDDPFIVEFRNREESLAKLAAGLQQLHAARAIAHAVTVDQLAIETRNPVKPSRILVLVLSVVLGGMTGVFAAFVINFVQKQKAKSKE